MRRSSVGQPKEVSSDCNSHELFGDRQVQRAKTGYEHARPSVQGARVLSIAATPRDSVHARTKASRAVRVRTASALRGWRFPDEVPREMTDALLPEPSRRSSICASLCAIGHPRNSRACSRCADALQPLIDDAKRSFRPRVWASGREALEKKQSSRGTRVRGHTIRLPLSSPPDDENRTARSFSALSAPDSVSALLVDDLQPITCEKLLVCRGLAALIVFLRRSR